MLTACIETWEPQLPATLFHADESAAYCLCSYTLNLNRKILNWLMGCVLAEKKSVFAMRLSWLGLNRVRYLYLRRKPPSYQCVTTKAACRSVFGNLTFFTALQKLNANARIVKEKHFQILLIVAILHSSAPCDFLGLSSSLPNRSRRVCAQSCQRDQTFKILFSPTLFGEPSSKQSIQKMEQNGVGGLWLLADNSWVQRVKLLSQVRELQGWATYTR